MPQPKTRVRRATVRLAAVYPMPETKRGYGFRVDCDCGWKSKVYRRKIGARVAAWAHEEWHEETARVSLAGPV